ncbi:hypothetical protein [Maribacter sp. 1_MG-2023]|uniref:hypothetical protein n=1 Tax=Maribacter sp. 1_MG-2023 TaxID=3062677 RepID=UPI0026E3383A|nr:hypothetical protein [Maribacter sp. 1_MG-2023]MDO6473343.1 hypothetical protein [Maribacter sp. 1_MG-2023]
MELEEIQKRLDDVETKITYITEMLKMNAETMKNLLGQMTNLNNRAYDDEAILKIHNASNQNLKISSDNIESITKIYGLITENNNSITDIYNHLSTIYDKL